MEVGATGVPTAHALPAAEPEHGRELANATARCRNMVEITVLVLTRIRFHVKTKNVQVNLELIYFKIIVIVASICYHDIYSIFISLN